MELELDMVTALGIVVTEVTTNAYLHAFPQREGEIKVTLSHAEGKGVLTIADNGVGFVPKETSKRHGVGLIKRLMEQANGTAALKSDQGTVWTLLFPTDGKDPVMVTEQ